MIVQHPGSAGSRSIWACEEGAQRFRCVGFSAWPEVCGQQQPALRTWLTTVGRIADQLNRIRDRASIRCGGDARVRHKKEADCFSSTVLDHHIPVRQWAFSMTDELIKALDAAEQQQATAGALFHSDQGSAPCLQRLWHLGSQQGA